MCYSFSSKKLLVTLIGGLSTLFIASTSAFADELDSGAYININAGLGLQLPAENSSSGLASSINVGYNFNRYLGMDAGFNSMSGVGASLTGNLTDIFGVINDTKIYTLAAKGSLPLAEIFYLYGRLGLGYQNSSYTNISNSTSEYNTAVALIAAGGAFHLGKHFELHLEDSLFSPLNSQAPASTTNMLQLGVQYNF